VNLLNEQTQEITSVDFNYANYTGNIEDFTKWLVDDNLVLVSGTGTSLTEVLQAMDQLYTNFSSDFSILE